MQPFLLPPSPVEWLPEDHLAWFVLEVVQQLDLTAIEDVIQSKDPRGTTPYDPRMMTALLVYAYASGVRSSRKIERATYEDVAFRVLAGGQHPDHWTINNFRMTHWRAFKTFFVQVLRMAQRMGLLKLGRVALDGTKVQANASKHKAMSYDRMKKEIGRLEAEVEDLLKQAEAVDREEDAQDEAGRDLPSELRRREDRLRKIRAAREALEQEARQARAAELRGQEASLRAKAGDPTVSPKKRKEARTLAGKRAAAAEALVPDPGEDDDDDDDPDDDLPQHRVKHSREGAPAEKAQQNFTDPDSRIMMQDGSHFVQAYNCQALVDEGQFILAEGVGNQSPDVDYLSPLVSRAIAVDLVPEHLLADAGYWSAANAGFCAEVGIDAYISVERLRRAHERTYAVGPPPEDASPKECMRHKVATRAGAEMYGRRKVLPEPVFGQIKEERGFRRFSVRGLEKVRGEWSLVCLVHNLVKLWRAGQPIAAPA